MQVPATASSMPPPLEVDPQGLLDSADQVERQARDLKSLQDAAHTRMEVAQAGWTGRSSEALHRLVAKWRTDTETMSVALAEHAGALRAAGQTYQDTDARAAKKIMRAGTGLDDPGTAL